MIDRPAVPCHILPRRSLQHPDLPESPTCWHRSCYLATLPPALAARLARNDEARDWLGNFGRMLYDLREHGRDPQRRALAARVIRGMRSGAIDYLGAIVDGAWAGAVLR